ncbi:SDR family NAD(P)-dependent oxidoreductase [Cryobacterium aureum]|uniref:SDR family NAD(P)-dependent oxidoreductase n=1 Tax=Cryobacterium aureum TaxID=995037 RepID=UPI001F0C5AD8|nr:SDR family NAD(P)-dependent oxidoreductase [Cryobacterium aureum]
MFDLTGRVALITGAASGIGAATARIFAEAGADVALAFYPPDGHDIRPVVAAVEAAGRRAITAPVDVSSTADVEGLVKAAENEFGAVHIVVANAGIARTVRLADLDDVAWNSVMEVDLHGAWRCFRAAIPSMQREKYGRLLATSSVAGTVSGWPEHSHYAAAKAGLVGLVKSLAVEFGGDGITANAVAPGVIRTPQSLDPVNSLGPAGVDAAAKKIPAGRVGVPDDIGYVYRFLASQEASYVNGQLLVVDGGRNLAGLD